MWLTIYYIFSYLIFFYTLVAMALLTYLSVSSYRAQNRLKVNLPDDETIRYMLKTSPLTPPVSVIASAYNERVTIKDNINSLLKIDYPNYEIIIVNDESTDNTLEIMIEEFSLVEVPYTDTKKVPSKPIKKVYRSTDEKYKQLVVVDKEHAGTKSDGINAGINVCTSPYFINTDVDCIVEPMAIYRMMWLVVNSHVPMIGVGATMLMVNGCKVEDGVVTAPAVANNPFPWYQQMEYMRSFLVGKMGWISHNVLPNISGGFGLFDTDIVIKSGGYDPESFAEDVDMLLRMVTYMKNTRQDFRLGQIPQVCCWTEGPFTPRAIYRQRTRWARGLCEIVSNHRRLFFNPAYGLTGMFTLPYIFFFEFLAPILEVGGIIFMVWLVMTGRVNWNTTFVIFAMIFVFSVSLSFVVLVYDFAIKAVKWKHPVWSYIKLVIAGFTEPIIYHPLITLFSIIGYGKFITKTSKVWSQIKRKGVSGNEEEKQKTPSRPVAAAPAAAAVAVAKAKSSVDDYDEFDDYDDIDDDFGSDDIDDFDDFDDIDDDDAKK